MGSMVSMQMDVVVHEIWDWALSTKNWITATHIPGIFNIEADKESRVQEERTEWILSKTVFDDIIKQLEFKPDIDLFASRLNKQIPEFVSFRPDPESMAVNAFNMDWGNKKFYAFPPFICVPHVLQKIWQDRALGIVIVPDWSNQIWYCQYLNMVIREIVIAPRSNLLTLPSSNSSLPLHRTLQLRAALISGKSCNPKPMFQCARVTTGFLGTQDSYQL